MVKPVAKVTVDQVADAILVIKARKAKHDPIEKARQELVKKQLTISYDGIYS